MLLFRRWNHSSRLVEYFLARTPVAKRTHSATEKLCSQGKQRSTSTGAPSPCRASTIGFAHPGILQVAQGSEAVSALLAVLFFVSAVDVESAIGTEQTLHQHRFTVALTAIGKSKVDSPRWWWHQWRRSEPEEEEDTRH